MSEYELSAMLEAWRTQPSLLIQVMQFVAGSYMLKGAILVALAIGVVAPSRERLLTACDYFIVRLSVAAFTAAAIGRALQIFLPHRDRPFVAFQGGDWRSSFALESSFPSDHGVYMTCIAMAIFLKNRTLGGFALLWTILAILTPRVLLNFHYPSDVIIGAALGAVIGWIAIRTPISPRAARLIRAADRELSVLIYPLAFIFAYSATTNFEDLRGFVAALLP